MATEQEIKQGIISSTGGIYRVWYIGLTDDPDKAKKEAGSSAKNWKAWKADSDVVAKGIIKFFTDAGVKQGPGTGTPVYIYMKR
ncbi:MAG: hypothetical protein NTV30_07565 [Chloroflexi bacterium]|nr:hypothetical protein [Chloroflexota bacterium]